MNQQTADVILHNGRIATQDNRRSVVEAVAIRDGKFLAIGSDLEIVRFGDERTQLIDLNKRTVIPGLNDSHLHLIRGGLNYNLELRWDGVPSLADGLRMLREQAQRTPPGQWVRVVGGWTEFQFAERRMPTLDELNRAAPDTPGFRSSPLRPGAAEPRRAAGGRLYQGLAQSARRRDCARCRRQSDRHSHRQAERQPSCTATLAKGPKLPPEYQVNSTRHFMRELNRLGITSAIDAGGGFQNYPEDYQVIEQLHKNGELTVRIAYNLFTQKPKEELADFQRLDRCGASRGKATISFATTAPERCWCSRPRISRTSSSRVPTCPAHGAGTEARGEPAGEESLAVPSARDLRRDDHARA